MNLGDSGLIAVHRIVVEKVRLLMNGDEDAVHLVTEINEPRIAAGAIFFWIAGLAEERELSQK